MKTLILVLVLALSGCYSMGAKVKSEQLTQFKKGVTTIAEAQNALGQPTTITKMGDGTTVLSYMHIQAQARPESFIPIVGAFVGGSDSNISSVNLVFKDGVLFEMNSSESTYGGGYGLSGGPTMQRTDQPR